MIGNYVDVICQDDLEDEIRRLAESAKAKKGSIAKNIDLDELISEGWISAMGAIERHDSERSSFIRYLRYVVRRDLDRYILSQTSGPLSVSTATIDRYHRGELSASSTRQLDEARSATSVYTVRSVDDEDTTDWLPDPNGVDVGDAVAEYLQRQILLDAVRGLPDNYRDVVMLFYGLNGEEAHTDQQVADRLGLTRRAVVRRRQRALERLSEVLYSC